MFSITSDKYNHTFSTRSELTTSPRITDYMFLIPKERGYRNAIFLYKSKQVKLLVSYHLVLTV